MHLRNPQKKSPERERERVSKRERGVPAGANEVPPVRGGEIAGARHMEVIGVGSQLRRFTLRPLPSSSINCCLRGAFRHCSNLSSSSSSTDSECHKLIEKKRKSRAEAEGERGTPEEGRRSFPCGPVAVMFMYTHVFIVNSSKGCFGERVIMSPVARNGHIWIPLPLVGFDRNALRWLFRILCGYHSQRQFRSLISTVRLIRSFNPPYLSLSRRNERKKFHK